MKQLARNPKDDLNSGVSLLGTSRRLLLRCWQQIEHLIVAWQGLSLRGRFAITSTLVVTGCMVVLGAWANQRIVQGVVQSTANSAANYLIGFVEPHVQELTHQNELSLEVKRRLDTLFESSLLRTKNIVTVKIWSRDGALLYSSDKAIDQAVIGDISALRRAWAGEIVAEYNQLDADESSHERALNAAMLEVYAPLRSMTIGRVIGVVEIYEVAETLADDLNRTFIETFIAVGLFSTVLLVTLMRIVNNGSHTINVQQRELKARVSELSSMLRVNEQLRHRVNDAIRRASKNNELLLRRMGAELHDGPVQLVSLGLLRLNALDPLNSKLDPRSAKEAYPIVKSALEDALAEVRNICGGLALPELDCLSLVEAITLATRNHEQRTGSDVSLQLDLDLPVKLSVPVLTAVYRCVQEGLTNSYRHAAARGQKVMAYMDGEVLTITVSDSGPGFTADVDSTSRTGLGIPGMRDRVVSLNGEFSIQSGPDGVVMSVSFKLDQLGEDHA